MQTGEQRHRLPAAAELGERVVRLGRGGLGRAEIAAELGVGLDALARMERKSARLAGALARAAEAERAWWEAQPREALAAGAPLNMSAWFAAMQWRFGAASGRAASGPPGAGEAAADEPARPRAIYILPDNGKERRAPDGTPMTRALRKARTLAPIQGEIDRLEARLAHFRELLSEYAADDYEDYHDDDDDDDGDGDDGDGDDDDQGDEVGDEDGEARGGVAGSDGDGPQPIPRGPAVPAEGAGPPAWAAQPHGSACGPGDPAGVRDAPGGELLGGGARLAR